MCLVTLGIHHFIYFYTKCTHSQIVHNKLRFYSANQRTTGMFLCVRLSPITNNISAGSNCKATNLACDWMDEGTFLWINFNCAHFYEPQKGKKNPTRKIIISFILFWFPLQTCSLITQPSDTIMQCSHFGFLKFIQTILYYIYILYLRHRHV